MTYAPHEERYDEVEVVLEGAKASQRDLTDLAMRVDNLFTSIVKLTRVVDNISLDLTRRLTEIETALTYHEETPHIANTEV